MNKIILDCDLMRYRNTGLYHYCLNLGNYVNRLLQENGEEEMRFYVPPREELTFPDRRNVIVERSYHKFFKPFLFGCRIWHAPFQSGRLVPVKNKSIKVILTIHDLNPLHEDLPAAQVKKSIAHTQWLIDNSNTIVCISEFCKQDVLANCDTGNKPIFVIHNGTHAVHRPGLEIQSYRPTHPFLFAMGDVNRKKNFHTLVPLLENQELEIVIAGRLAEPDYIENMKEDAKARGVIDRLHILGPVKEGEKAWYLENCKAFVHPSLAEGFGAPVVEAMSFGKPLFLSSLTSLPEIGGEVAYYFRNFEPSHMQQVLQEGLDEFSKSELTEKILERSRQFNWEVKAKEYLNVYKTLL
jgi:glycosyltransferase involved in cell wall biosynthesis